MMEGKKELGYLMETVMSNLQRMVDVNTIVGDSVETKEGTVILPISKVSFGFVAGGAEYDGDCRKEELPFAGGSGAGVSLQPVAFMVVGEDQIRLLSVNQNSLYDRIIDSVPTIIDKISDNLKMDSTNNENKGE